MEAADGRRLRGYAADNLPPKWFDKDPTKGFRDNVDDQLASIRAAHEAYLTAGRAPRSVFDIWLDARAEARRRGAELGLNSLDPDGPAMTPLADWKFETLEAGA